MPSRYTRRRIKNKLQVWKERQLTARNAVIVLILVLIFIIVAAAMIVIAINSDYSTKIYSKISDLPIRHTGLVLGLDSTVNDTKKVLEERADNAVTAFKSGKFKEIIISGNKESDGTTESDVIYDSLVEDEVEEGALQVDYAAVHTYAACYRAKHKLSAEKVTIVAHRQQLVRALYICNSLGLDAIGLEVVTEVGYGENLFQEVFGMLQAIWQVNIAPPTVN